MLHGIKGSWIDVQVWIDLDDSHRVAPELKELRNMPDKTPPVTKTNLGEAMLELNCDDPPSEPESLGLWAESFQVV